MADEVLRGDNIYAPHILFPYTPFSQFLPAWLLLFADATSWRFDFAVKLPCAIADAGTSLLIFGYLRWRGVGLAKMAGWTLAWALNPVSILITAFHGNLMAIVPFLVTGALVAADVADESPNRDLLLPISALLLGLAIALRSFPILILPAFLVLFARTFREALTFGGLAALPAGLSSLPYLIFARETFLREVGSYSGSTDFGWLSVIRTLPYLYRGEKFSTFAGELLDQSKGIFLFAIGLATPCLLFFRRSALGRATLLAPLLFFGLYGGVSGQYLVWVVPVAILLRQRAVLAFSLVGAAALASFYVIYHPGILFGRYPPAIPESGAVGAVYALSNAALVVLSLAWAIQIVLSELWAYRRGRWSTPVAWVRRLRPVWSSRVFAVGLILAFLAWSWQTGAVFARAQTLALTYLPSTGRLFELPGPPVPPAVRLVSPVSPVGQDAVPDASTSRFRSELTIGRPGGDNGEFSAPRGVAATGDSTVFVADTGNGRVQMFNRDGRFLKLLGGRGDREGEFREPTAMRVSPHGQLYILDSGNGWISKFDQGGHFLARVGGPAAGFFGPRGFDVDDRDRIFVASAGQAQVIELDPRGQRLSTLGGAGGDLREPTDVMLLPDGSLVVVDPGVGRLYHLESDGRLRAATSFPKAASVDGPHLAPLPDGAILATDPAGHRLLLFDRDLAPIGAFGREGTAPGLFRVPVGLAVGVDGAIYVSETVGGRIQRLRP
jgi:hypothetical protein